MSVRPACHLDRGPLCMNRTHYEMPIEFSRAYIAYTEMTQPSIIFDSECALKYMDEIYWRAKNIIVEYDNINWLSLYLFLIIGAGLILVGGIVLSILYFYRTKYEEVNLDEIKNYTEISDDKIGPGPTEIRQTEII